MSRGVFAALLAFFVLSSTPAAAESSKTGWDDVDFPVWAKDIRRAEIITLGSVPFVTLWTTLGYSMAVYGEFRNPMSTNTDDFTESDKKKIIAMTGGICLGLGLFDLAVTLVKRASSRRNSPVDEGALKVVPRSSAVEDGGMPDGDVEPPPRPDRGDDSYLIEGVVQNAVF